MSTESLTNSASHASSSTSHTKPSEQIPLSDSIQNDLITTSQLSKAPTTKTNNHHQQQTAPAGAAGLETTTLASKQQGSPTKSTPTKSRNKRRNEARKRSANNKKQQATSMVDDSECSLQPQQEKESMMTTSPTEKRNPLKMSTTRDQEHELKLTISDTSQNEGLLQKRSPTNTKDDEHKVNESIQITGVEMSPVKELGEQHPSDKPPHHSTSGKLDSKDDHNFSNEPVGIASNNRNLHDSNSWRRKQRENRELKEQIKIRDSQIQTLAERMKHQIGKIKELEASLVSTTRTCGQFEKLLQQELSARTRLEAENDNLNATVARLKNQIISHERDKSTNSELIRVLNATLMERETEVSILKLKMTRLQTNPPISLQNTRNSNSSLAKPDPCKSYIAGGRSNSEFSRNSYSRSTMMADSINTRSSASQLANDLCDASVWANVPEELTPSKRPLLLERNLPAVYDQYQNTYNDTQSSTPITRDRRYRTMPRSMKSPEQVERTTTLAPAKINDESTRQPANCLVTNLDDSNNTSRSSGNQSADVPTKIDREPKSMKQSSVDELEARPVPSGVGRTRLANEESIYSKDNHSTSHYSTIGNTKSNTEIPSEADSLGATKPPSLPARSPSTPIKISFGLKKILGKFKRSDSSVESKSKTDLSLPDPPTTPSSGPFQRGSTRSTMMAAPSSFVARAGPRKAADFITDKPFAEWDTNMLVDWLTTIGLSMYANQCRRWVKCGAHIMNATPCEVDKGLGITNHLHRKKLRLAISELNGDCDKITKAAAKLDYFWVARWLDDIGLPQYKEEFINARVDGRVLNYLTIEDLVSLGVKSLLHHSSIRCGIKVLRSINFDLQLLKRRATAEEIEHMSSMRQSIEDGSDNYANVKNSVAQQVGENGANDVPLWTCHRVMEWLRMIDFAEFAPNLRGSGVHGGLIMYEDAFNIDTMSALLSILSSRTLLRRHLSTFFQNLIGEELVLRKRQYKDLSTNHQLNPSAEIKTHRKSPLWFGKLKGSKVGQDGMDEYLCPMYPVEPQIVKSPIKKLDHNKRECSNLPRIPESVNV